MILEIRIKVILINYILIYILKLRVILIAWYTI